MDDQIFGRIHSIETFGALDGPGIRYIVFLQGCPLRCKYCHNPDSWDASAGSVWSAGRLMNDILRYKNFISSGGVTLSGGEPLLQHEFCGEVLRMCGKNGLHTAVDTSGVIPLASCRDAVDAADLILLDIKELLDEDAKNLTGTGSRNALELLAYREETQKPVWIRHVLIPGITMIDEKLMRLRDYLADFKCIEKIELLPFHQMGGYKWEALGRAYPLKDTPEPTQEEILHAKSLMGIL